MSGVDYRRQSTARYGATEKCAVLGCGGTAAPGGVYCRKCQSKAAKPLEETDSEEWGDIQLLLFSEKVRGENTTASLIERYGTRPCGICGKPSLPNHQYCSERCRTRARMGEQQMIEIDGIVASVPEHAHRLGIKDNTFYKRMRKGVSIKEALTKPIDKEMRRRALCSR